MDGSQFEYLSFPNHLLPNTQTHMRARDAHICQRKSSFLYRISFTQ